MPRPPQTWRNVERKIAELLDGRRVGILGDQDVETEELDVEVKHGDQIPKTIIKWWEQATNNCSEDKTPVLVLHPPRFKYTDSLVIVRLKDWLQSD